MRRMIGGLNGITALRVLAGGGRALPLSYSDTFARADGAPGYGWYGPGWSISSGKLINTLGLGEELFTDGGLEAWSSATNLTSWAEAVGGASTINQEATVKHAGSYSVRADIDASASNAQITQIKTLVPGAWYQMSGWLYSSAIGKKPALIANNVLPLPLSAPRDPGPAWSQHFSTFRCVSASVTAGVRHVASSAYSYYADDLSMKLITSPLWIAKLFGTPYADISVSVSRVLGTQAGIMFNMDNPYSPQNYGLCYLDGIGNVRLDTFVNGVWSNVVAVAATYVDGATLRLVHLPNSQTTYRMIYNNAQVGADQTIADESLISNRWHGAMSTHPSNSIDNFFFTVAEATESGYLLQGDGASYLLQGDGTSKLIYTRRV